MKKILGVLVVFMSSFAIAADYKCKNEGATEMKKVHCKQSGNSMTCTEEGSSDKLTCTKDKVDPNMMTCKDGTETKKTCKVDNNETDVEENINKKVGNP